MAIGGDFSVERLALAYRSGIFPWTDQPITWWSPDPRAIFEIQSLTLSKNLKRVVGKHSFTVTFDQDFLGVIRGCSQERKNKEETWISEGFIEGYTAFHKSGYAHSVEVWEGKELVGGVYGVGIGGFFAGESMFYRRPNASKIALISLWSHLKKRGFVLFDTQVLNPFTKSLGAIEISREDYLVRLKSAIHLPVCFL